MAILTASKYAPVPTDRKAPPQPAWQILVKQARKRQTYREWVRAEMKEGRYLHRYLGAEKHGSERRWRNVRRRTYGRLQNNKSEFRRLADVPLRDFIRWRRQDPNFWNENSNLRSLKRDVPDAAIYL